MKILFLCVANSARSQMAEGLARELFGNNADISSAGSKPTKVNPFAIEAMKNIDIDISSQHSKSIDEALSGDVDWVITLCKEEICPVVPEASKTEHWPFDDPADAAGSDATILHSFENIRDQIRSKLISFGTEHRLLAPSA